MNRHTMLCVSCRRVARSFNRSGSGGGTMNCPSCRQPMRDMGYRWRAPKQRDEAAWRRIERGDIWTEDSARETDRRNWLWPTKIIKGRRMRRDVRNPR